MQIFQLFMHQHNAEQHRSTLSIKEEGGGGGYQNTIIGTPT